MNTTALRLSLSLRQHTKMKIENVGIQYRWLGSNGRWVLLGKLSPDEIDEVIKNNLRYQQRVVVETIEHKEWEPVTAQNYIGAGTDGKD